MQLKTLLASLPLREIIGPVDRAVESIAYDSRRVQRDGLFVALRGEKSDGHNFIGQAIEKGATVIVTEQPEKNSRATCVVVENTRAAMPDLAARFFNYPARKLKLAGVTGTNGKTTTTFLIKHICEKAGTRCGLLGTVRYEIGERVLPAARTTPESLDLQELLAQMRDAGCRAAAMEVSSHALAQERVRDIEWDAAIFTNLTQDHLDYHRTMENYFEAKAKLFEQLAKQDRKKKPVAIINIDDRYGQKLVAKISSPSRNASPARIHGATSSKVSIVTFGTGLNADFRASNYRMEFGGTSYQLDARGKSYLVRVPLIGRFNVANSVAALAAANALGVGLREAVLSLAKSPQVPGRLEMVPAKRQFQVFVDYAHTPDALLNVIKTLRELGPRRLIIVFGCGGNRDREKRPLMGQVVDQNADYAIITSDNPRKEDPDEIIADVEKGFRGSHFEKITDRAAAISRAVEHAQSRDIVLIAGKGHENYQEFADHTVPFEDIQVARRAIENHPMEFK
ncbi:MAG TPA: UDP-N-acetylmuramoyl-L-alanyl-D-glutamate--2,6-diaminopimelate ligase [Chthoniobacterales bacterium]|nr:UDP-N-acetylmuramoyl-L-alanyl-D-glutamate--2,6-diaminopimelate ligase [Chthoniobacterales bacterium]